MTDDIGAPSLSDEVRSELTLPTVPGPESCNACRGWAFPNEPICNSCALVSEQLGLPWIPVVPVTLYCKPSRLRDWLTHYKKGEEAYEPDYSIKLTAILSSFVDANERILGELFGPWDAVTVVPSTSRQPPHPMYGVLEGTSLGSATQALLTRTDAPIAHRAANAAAFEANANVRPGMRVLLVDDVFTTGSYSQSAGSALSAVGAIPAAILAIGRRVNPEFDPVASRVWQRQRELPFDYHRSAYDLAPL